MKCLACDLELIGVAKKYCNNICQNVYQNKVKLENWLNGWNPPNNEIPDPIRKFLFEKAGFKCECGWDKINPKSGRCPLTIDHIDGNATNNLRSNLKVL